MADITQVLHSVDKKSSLALQTGVPAVGQVTNVPSNVARYFGNIDMLRAADPTGVLDGAIFGVLGYYSAKDAFLPEYIWDAANTDADNGYGIIKPNSLTAQDAGRYIPRYAGAVRASAAGVVGGEVNAESDTNILRSLNGYVREIIIDRDVSIHGSRLKLTNTILTGDSGSETLIKIRPAVGFNDRCLIEIEANAVECQLVGLDIDTLGFASTANNRAVDAVWIRANTDRTKIAECTIKATGANSTDNQAYLIRMQDLQVNNVTIEKCTLAECYEGIYFRTGGRGLRVRQCEISEYYNHAFFSVPDTEEPEDMILDDIYVHSNKTDDPNAARYPIGFGAVGSNCSIDVTVQNCRVIGWPGTAHGQGIGTGTADAYNFQNVKRGKLINNTVMYSGGMGITCTRYSEDILIQGNHCMFGNAAGIITGSGARNIFIQGNHCFSNVNNYLNLFETNNYGGITAQHANTAPRTTRFIKIANNHCGNVDGVTPTQPYGVNAEFGPIGNVQILDLEIGRNYGTQHTIGDLRVR